ncbi:MAG TPA: hypothetical protein VK699_02255 [Terriglobales bacterium]|jgi:hypothetical protein|nr:hypothetical protein [Terriglobales bacterium]
MERKTICRISKKAMRWLLRWTPRHFQGWGMAMAAELEVIDQPLESLQWVLGCAGVILRQAILNVCFGACRDAWFWITAKEEGTGMRTARIAAISALLIVFGFFFAPSFRQAMSIAGDTLYGVPWARSGSGQQELRGLRLEAEREHDAKMLAYVALHEDSLEIAGQDADKAVAIDPQWTWVYYVLAGRDMGGMPHPLNPQLATWIAKLQRWDPQNAAPYLLEAERLVHATRFDHSAEQKIAGNSLWIQTMTLGFDAPRYDIYFQQRFNIERYIARQQGLGNPLRFTLSLISHPLPNLAGVRQYEKLILSGAQNSSDLNQQARRVALFGERMMASDTEIEEISGQELALIGYRKLEGLALPTDRAFIAVRIAQLEAMKSRKIPTFYHAPFRDAFAANAAIVQVCFVLMLITALTLAGSCAVLVFRCSKWSSTIKTIFYIAVGGLLTTSAVAFVAYLPYFQLVTQATATPSSVKSSVPLLMPLLSFANPASYARHGGVYGWACVLVLLTFLALWILVRQFHRSRSETPAVNAG